SDGKDRLVLAVRAAGGIKKIPRSTGWPPRCGTSCITTRCPGVATARLGGDRSWPANHAWPSVRLAVGCPPTCRAQARHRSHPFRDLKKEKQIPAWMHYDR